MIKKYKMTYTDDSEFAKSIMDDGVVCKGDSLLINFSKTTFVDHLPDILQCGVSPSNVRSNKVQHLKGSLHEVNIALLKHSLSILKQVSHLVQLDEDGVVDLSQSKKLQDLLDLGAYTYNTTNTNNDSNFTLGF